MKIQIYFFLWLFLFGAFIKSVAQPDLRIESVRYQNSRLEVRFNVFCGLFKKYDLKEFDFTVWENGLPVSDFTITCADTTQHCCKTIGLLTPYSALARIYDGDYRNEWTLISFIEKMQPCDEATFVTYAGTLPNNDPLIRIKQTVTHDTVALKKAVWSDTLDGGGYRDHFGLGFMTTIHEAEKGSNNPCKAIVIFNSHHAYNPAPYTWQQLRDTALAFGYKVYAYLPFAGDEEDSSVVNLCRITGGEAFVRIGNQDTTIATHQKYMRLIYDLIDQQDKFCTLSYDSPCKDGTQRTVQVTVNKCGGQATKTITYNARYDSTSFNPVVLQLGILTVKGGENVTIDLNLSPDVVARFQLCTFRITYDPACCTFLNLNASNGLLKNIPLTVQTSPGIIDVTTQQAFELNGSGILASLNFKASDPVQDVECPVRFASWTFDHGCLIPTLVNGKIIITARKPLLECFLDLPDSVYWDRWVNNYTPNPFVAFLKITNTGDREARNVKAKITLPSDKSLTLAGPMVDTQPSTPSLMKINSLSTAGWGINAKERMISDSLQVCIEVWADNHPTIQCCKKIYIPVVGARLACALSVDKIKVDTKLNRYTPMPFTIIDTVRNTGGLPTDTVFTTIILPQGLTLANVPNNSQIKRTQPIKLNSQMRGTASWQLYHPITIEEKKYTITICNRTGYPSLRERNADSVCCDVDIIIPQIDAPVLECTVTAVDSLFYDEVKDEYNPNPFPFTVAVKNTASLDADSVRATIVLPPEFVLEPPTQPTTKYFNPILVVKYTLLLPPNKVSWMVKALDQKKRKASEIKVKINGVMK